MCNRARSTRTANSSAFGSHATMRTDFCPAICKIFAVFFSVAIYAEGYSVSNIKSQFGKISPSLNMMGVKFAAISTSNASVLVAAKDGHGPFPTPWHKSGLLIMKRLTSLPVRRFIACTRYACTTARTKTCFAVAGIKLFTTIFTKSFWKWISCRPTMFTAKLGVFSTVSVCPIFFATNRANQCDTFSPAQYNASLFSHSTIIHSNIHNIKIDPIYCDVIVQRYEDFSGKKAKLEKG